MSTTTSFSSCFHAQQSIPGQDVGRCCSAHRNQWTGKRETHGTRAWLLFLFNCCVARALQKIIYSPAAVLGWWCAREIKWWTSSLSPCQSLVRWLWKGNIILWERKTVVKEEKLVEKSEASPEINLYLIFWVLISSTLTQSRLNRWSFSYVLTPHIASAGQILLDWLDLEYSENDTAGSPQLHDAKSERNLLDKFETQTEGGR